MRLPRLDSMELQSDERTMARHLRAEGLRSHSVGIRNLMIGVGTKVVLRMPLAPEARALGSLSSCQTVSARRLDELPGLCIARAVREHGARRVAHEALGYRTE